MKAEYKSVGPNIIEIKISGRIDETTAFPQFESASLKTIKLELADVEGISSMGILHWIRWWKNLAAGRLDLQFEIHNARPNMITCGSVVNGFFPDNSKVFSFYLNYYNEDNKHTIQEFFKKDINFDDHNIKIPEVITRKYNGQEIAYDLDCIPSKDLRSLKLEVQIV